VHPKPWSISSLSDFANCPKAYHHKRVLKDVDDPPNEAGLYGDYVHKRFEAYLRGEITDLADLSSYKDYLDTILALPGTLYPERKYGITKKGEPCDFESEGVWCRGIIDVLVINGTTATIIDHKTGKRKFDTKQLKLCSLLVMYHHPEIDRVRTGYMWLKDGAFDTETYARDQITELWGDFAESLQQYKQAFRTETFGPRPSGLCNGWCPVTQCDFWKPKRR
jgi:hypothetical protein